MVAQRQYTTRLSPEEYLERERTAAFKSEYLDGEVFPRGEAPAQTDNRPNHSAITFNIGVVIGAQLRGGSCRGFANDVKISSDAAGPFSSSDLSVACGEPRFFGPQQDVLANPALIIEVLSPSTELFDRGRKFARYQHIESLTDYVLVAQDEPRIEHFARQGDGRWLLSTEAGREGALSIFSLGVTLPLAEVYERIAFAAPEAPPPQGTDPPR